MKLINTKIKIGGVQVTDALVKSVYAVLTSFDRLPENPDQEFLRETVEKQLTERGLLNLVVFVCPQYNPQALLTAQPECFMPEKALSTDLFEPRVNKIKELRRELLEKCGVVTTLDVIIGDSGPKLHLFPFLQGLNLDMAEYLRRQRQYYQSFKDRSQREFGPLAIVWSLADLGIWLDETDAELDQDALSREVEFRLRLYQDTRLFKDFRFTAEIIREMSILEFRAYGAQGQFLTELGGVLLQTEGPGMWLQRTKMYRCTGARAIPAIYPWIRREELKSLK